MKYSKITGEDFYHMLVNAANSLEEQKEYVNSLNVFPVPDGDTGTNMSLTFRLAVKDVEHLKNSSIGEISKALSRGALMGARGNSGVILSQIMRGIAKGLENKEEVTGNEFGNALKEGANFAYKAVMRPTEGTILTVIREMGEFATAYDSEDVLDMLEKVCNHAEDVLNKTPEMLPQLKEAQVVDAGGKGLNIIVEGMRDALKYDFKGALGEETVAKEEAKGGAVIESEEDIVFGYCTEFIVLSDKVDEEGLKKFLSSIGDSVVVVTLDDIVKVHVHTDNPGRALEKAGSYGELSRIKIDNMREQHRENIAAAESAAEKIENKMYGFVAVARGEGVENIFKDLGVDYIIEGGQTMNPSTQDIMEAISAVNADNVFVMPNNKNIMMAAQQAQELEEEKNVIVLPTKTIPEGIAALSLFNPESDVESNEEEMKEVIEGVKTGSVTYAVKDTEASGKKISEGDLLGIVEGDIEIVGADKYKVCEDVIDAMADEDSELITILSGEETDSDEIEELIEKLEEKYPDMDIEHYEGKQPLYYFIVSVE